MGLAQFLRERYAVEIAEKAEQLPAELGDYETRLRLAKEIAEQDQRLDSTLWNIEVERRKTETPEQTRAINNIGERNRNENRR